MIAMSETLSEEDVQKVARLARITLKDDEVAMFQKSLSSVLGYVEILNEVDTTDVEPMTYAIETHNVFREDVVTESLPRDVALSNAPKADDSYFLVPAILDAES